MFYKNAFNLIQAWQTALWRMHFADFLDKIYQNYIYWFLKSVSLDPLFCLRNTVSVGLIMTDTFKRSKMKSSQWDSSSYLAHSADAHVQRLGVAAGPVQHFGGQLHHEARHFRFALESAGVVGVIVHRKPLVVLTLVPHVCVGRTLLGSEVTGIWRTILRGKENVKPISIISAKTITTVMQENSDCWMSK